MDKLFDNKRTYVDINGDEYINMSIPVVKVGDIKSSSLIRINEEGNGRLDRVVWNSVVQDMDMIDIMMYANHIFNPFSIKEGEIMYIPVNDDSVYSPSGEPSLPDGSKHSNNTKGEKEMSYADKVAYLAKKGLGVK